MDGPLSFYVVFPISLSRERGVDRGVFDLAALAQPNQIFLYLFESVRDIAESSVGVAP
jgi:hypothetical protein